MPRKSSPMPLVGPAPPVPARALALSVASLAVPVAASFILPDWTEQQVGMLVWLTALVPAFMLAYYRGSKGVALALAGGMAVLSTTQVAVLLLGISNPNWVLMLGVAVVYLAVSVGIAVVTEMLHRARRAAEALALVDRLTQLPNRRWAEFMLESAFAAATRGGALAVVLFDLDHFKQVNDTQGHAAGDQVLQKFAAVLKENTRRMHLSARFGGEEFLAVLADAPAHGAAVFADRVREGIKRQQFPWGRVTVSAGVAAYETGMGSYEVLIATADRALYAAKEAGRDQIVTVPKVGAVAPRPSQVRSAAVEVPDRTTGAEKIFVVDDDPHVRRAVVNILNRAGFRTEDTDDPQNVIGRYEDGGTDIDLVVTDVMMPKMNGLALMDRISQLDPDVRVIYMSSYVHGEVSWAGLPGSVVGFLEKPIRRQQLLATVQAVLHDEVSEGEPDARRGVAST